MKKASDFIKNNRGLLYVAGKKIFEKVAENDFNKAEAKKNDEATTSGGKNNGASTSGGKKDETSTLIKKI
ncbi:hypothetical protein Bca101_024916 [Brassica carinata]